MAKGSKKGNNGNKIGSKVKPHNQKSKILRIPQTGDAKRMRNVNDMNELSVFSWTSDEDDDQSHCSLEMNLSNQDKTNFEVARSNFENWIASVRTPFRQSGHGTVNPSPHPMQQLNNNPGTSNAWNSLFSNLNKEGLNLECPDQSVENRVERVVQISIDDVNPEIEYWNSAVICYILGVKPPFRIIEGFIRRMWGKFGVEKIAMMDNGVFVVRFRTVECKQKAVEMEPILDDRKPVIVTDWTPDFDLQKIDVKHVPTWIRLPYLPLKYWGKNSLNKLAGLIGKPIRTDRATAQKDILAYARILVGVSVDQEFPESISFMNQ